MSGLSTFAAVDATVQDHRKELLDIRLKRLIQQGQDQ